MIRVKNQKPSGYENGTGTGFIGHLLPPFLKRIGGGIITMIV